MNILRSVPDHKVRGWKPATQLNDLIATGVSGDPQVGKIISSFDRFSAGAMSEAQDSLLRVAFRL